MAVKVLVNSVAQHMVADTKQVENKETKEIVGYWLKNPRLVNYSRDEEGNINVAYAPYCILSDEQEFSVRANDIVAILEPRADVLESYTAHVTPETNTETAEPTEEVSNEAEPVAAEVG